MQFLTDDDKLIVVSKDGKVEETLDLGFKGITKVLPQTTQLVLMHGNKLDFKKFGKDEAAHTCQINAQITDFTYEAANPSVLYLLADDHITIMQL